MIAWLISNWHMLFYVRSHFFSNFILTLFSYLRFLFFTQISNHDRAWGGIQSTVLGLQDFSVRNEHSFAFSEMQVLTTKSNVNRQKLNLVKEKLIRWIVLFTLLSSLLHFRHFDLFSIQLMKLFAHIILLAKTPQ